MEPPYIINLLILLVLALIGVIPNWRADLGHFLASLFYSHNLMYGEPSVLNGVLWSLEVEIQFYLICPFLALFLNRFGRVHQIAIVTVFILVGVWFSIEFNPEETNIKSLIGYVHYFLIGVLISISTKYNDKSIKRYAIITVIAIVFYFSLVFESFLFKLIELALVFIVLFNFLRCKRISLGRNNLFVLIGSMVYSIYMYHYLIIIALVRFFEINTPSIFIGSILVLLSVLLSVPFYILFERPTMVRGWEKKLYERFSQRFS